MVAQVAPPDVPYVSQLKMAIYQPLFFSQGPPYPPCNGLVLYLSFLN